MANIVPRDENQMPREGQIFRVGDVCLASGIYKHSCGGNAHFEKGKLFTQHMRMLESSNAGFEICDNPNGYWVYVKI